MLADGLVFKGLAIGAEKETWGEVVFNTSQTGYQEILTDPSYHGQMVNFTFPHIGNYGVNSEDNEAPEPQVAGLIVMELAENYGHWRAEKSLNVWLADYNLSGIAGVDTRTLTLHLRRHGSQNGIISSTDTDLVSLLEKVRALPSMNGLNLAERVGCREPYQFAEGLGPTVAVLDLGVKKSILTQIAATGFSVKVWPNNATPRDILAENPAGIMLVNGPGDPAPCTKIIATVRELLGRVPIFGICLGHQILSLALGGHTFKLPFGHRGANHPVRDEKTGRISVTSQNHGFCVDPDTLPSEVIITHTNANDQTVEGLAVPTCHAFSVQYHPEASPGPHDARYLFDEFRCLINKFKRA